MQETNLPTHFFTNLHTDTRAEVVAAEMIEEGTPADRIIILMLGALQRNFRKELISVDEEISKFDHKEYFVLSTTKEGLYDMLPEGIFHSPTSNKSATEKEIIDSIKQRRVEERNARLFFLPFEAAISSIEVQLALYENFIDKRSQYDELVKMFSKHWEIFKYLDKRQANIFLHLLPIIHTIRDDNKVIESVLELIFQLPVNINLCPQGARRSLQPIVSTLNNCRLGVNLTTGNELYDEGVDQILIKFELVSNEVCQQFHSGRTNQKILALLCDYLLPVHVDTVIEFELSREDRVTRLAKDNNHLNAVLGSDTFL